MQYEPINPCPFCAGVGVAFTRDNQTGDPFNASSLAASEDGVSITAFVFCHECGAKGPPIEGIIDSLRKCRNWRSKRCSAGMDDPPNFP